MANNNNNNLGENGFIWWIGVVENRADPLNLGRAQVRIQNWHTDDKTLVPMADLPWAHTELPITGAHGPIIPPKEGSIVRGYFYDAEHGQYPVMTNIIPGIPESTPPINHGFSDQRTASQLNNSPAPPKSKKYNIDGSGVVITNASSAARFPIILNEPTTPRLARAENIDKTFIQERKDNIVKNIPIALDNSGNNTWSEPAPAYAAKYPFNIVTETESGHIVELDDTPGAERISQSHRSGTFYEIQPDGSVITKIVKNNYSITMANDKVLIMGRCDVTINGDATVYVKGNADYQVDGNLNWHVKGDWTTQVDGSVNMNIGGSWSVTIANNTDIETNGTGRWAADIVEVHAISLLHFDCFGNGEDWYPTVRNSYVIGSTGTSFSLHPAEIPG